jgi:hypothetical protein
MWYLSRARKQGTDRSDSQIFRSIAESPEVGLYTEKGKFEQNTSFGLIDPKTRNSLAIWLSIVASYITSIVSE